MNYRVRNSAYAQIKEIRSPVDSANMPHSVNLYDAAWDKVVLELAKENDKVKEDHSHRIVGSERTRLKTNSSKLVQNVLFHY